MFSTLRHRVIMQKQLTEIDSFGSEINTWQDIATVWASVEPLKGREFFAAQKENAETTVRICVRYRTGISPAMRIKFDDKIYEIIAIIDVEERHIELQLMCQELV